MKYTVKWIEDHLGVSRKALILYEDKGLLDASKIKNPKTGYREYDEDTIYYIWSLRILQGIGYTMNEIVEIVKNPEFDIQESLNVKISELEKKKGEIEENIGYAKMIKYTGLIPVMPDDFGDVKSDDFISQTHKEHNIYSHPAMQVLSKITDDYLNNNNRQLKDDEVAVLSETFQNVDPELNKIDVLFTQLANLKNLSIDDPEVVKIIRQLFELSLKTPGVESVKDTITPQKFAITTVHMFTAGDRALINKQIYGEEACKFIVNAVARFGGFESADDIL